MAQCKIYKQTFQAEIETVQQPLVCLKLSDKRHSSGAALVVGSYTYLEVNQVLIQTANLEPAQANPSTYFMEMHLRQTLKIWATLIAVSISLLSAAHGTETTCLEILRTNVTTSHDPPRKNTSSGVSKQELLDHVIDKITSVPEFQYIREIAQQMGIRVWLFGGTASSFLHYVKWDLARTKGLMDLPKDSFDFNFRTIFRSTQDLDIVVDTTPEVARQFQITIAEKFPHFLGFKANKWEVRTLRHRIGAPGQLDYKEALLEDPDFSNQNTDSNSLGMVEVTVSKDPIVRDLRHWNQTGGVFLEDTLDNQITYLRSNNHFETSRAKAGENPEILSVLRLLVKAFQFGLNFSDSDFKQMQEIISQFNSSTVSNFTAQRRMQETAKKLVIHAVNLEHAFDTMDKLGLRQKLIEMGNPAEIGNFAWWLNREPLRSGTVGEGSGRTARELKINVVAHETRTLLDYETILRTLDGKPNVFISRRNAPGERAIHGQGFYTRRGRTGAAGTGFTIRFTLDPNAREGVDFTLAEDGDFIIVLKKNALTVIHESLNINPAELIHLAEMNQKVDIDFSDSGLQYMFQRGLKAASIIDELERSINLRSEADFNRLVKILWAFKNSSVSKLIPAEVTTTVVNHFSGRIAQMSQVQSDTEKLWYVKTVGPILKILDSIWLLEKWKFIQYLEGLTHNRTETNFDLRKEALFEILLHNILNFEKHLNFKPNLSTEELKVVVTEIKAWHNSPDDRKKKFALELDKKWSKAIEKADIKTLEALIDYGFFEINHKNVSQVSILQLAAYYAVFDYKPRTAIDRFASMLGLTAYYKQSTIIDWLVQNQAFDFNARNTQGHTEIEQLRLSGRVKLADSIQRARPDAIGRHFQVKERGNKKTSEYPEGIPIVNFVRIEPNTFMMGENDSYNHTKVLAKVTEPFEIMTVDVTQKTYRIVVELIKQNLRNDRAYDELNASPSHFKGENRPVESVSYDDTSLWIQGLKELSKLDDPQVQKVLSEIFPGHNRGKIYSRGTEVQWELASRLGGVAEGIYPHGNGEAGLDDSAVYNRNSNRETKSVGSKQPVYYNGKPIYDLIGNVRKWVELESPVSQSMLRPVRGGSFDDVARNLQTGKRKESYVDTRYYGTSFRLFRTTE